MRMILGVMLLGALIMAMAGCEANNDRVVITRENNGGSVSVSRGDEVEVVLPGNPTTGYEWTLAKTDEALLPLVSSSYTPDSDAIGAGGTYRFRFKSVATGEVRLRLIYRRSWETTVAETFEVTVRIS